MVGGSLSTLSVITIDSESGTRRSCGEPAFKCASEKYILSKEILSKKILRKKILSE